MLYMEFLSYNYIKDKIDSKFNIPLDEEVKIKIEKYFKSEHNDKIITKNEIASAVRRFITRYLFNYNKKENIDENLDLCSCLQRKFLWNNHIFNEIQDNFYNLLKKYFNNFSFSLKVKHSIEFYDIIGEEEKKLFNEGKKIIASSLSNKEKIITKNNETKTNLINLGIAGGKKSNIKGPKMKKKIK